MTGEIELAYLAGLFDGEGCVTVTHTPPGGGRVSDHYSVRVQVKMVDRRPLERFAARFGGTVRMASISERNVRQPYVWTLCSAASARFLAEIRPYLTIKAPHADLVAEFAALPQRPGRAPTPPETAAARARIREKIMSFNYTRRSHA